MPERFQYLRSNHHEGLSTFSARITSFSYDKHAHEEYSIGVTRKGRQDFFSSGVFHKSNAGNVIFFNPEQVHDGCAGERTELEYDMIYIPEATLVNLMSTLGRFSKEQARLKMSLFHDIALRDQVLKLGQQMQQPSNSQLEEEAALLNIAQSVVRLGGGTLSEGRNNVRKDKLLLQAKDFIQDNLNTKLTVDDISNAASLSKYHFIRLFNEQFGITPHQYVLNCRLIRAKHAIERGEGALDVAVQFGFSDINHLNRKFKRVFGITPHQYQRQLSY
ncbi:AraC family ligand binding domain-containing protein [Pseudoalteromonas xiamenensis]